MDFQTFVFFFLSLVLIFAALRVITARNPVHAVLFLILAFFTCSGIWLLLQAEFLAIVLVLVYVGAVMVLFLFVVMMLDINIDRIREGFWRHLPLGVVVGALIVVQMAMVLASKMFRVPLGEAVEPAKLSNVKALGVLLFSEYAYPFELASIILLVGMIAAVVLTQRRRRAWKYTDPSAQIAVEAKDRIRILQMPTEKE